MAQLGLITPRRESFGPLGPIRTLQGRAPQGALAPESLQGRLIELSAMEGGAGLSLAIQLTLETQQNGEFAAWVQLAPSGSFYPPDVADAGVDLSTLPVIQVSQTVAATRVAEHLLRSGAFAVVVIDLSHTKEPEPFPVASQSRLLGLAQKHAATLLCLSHKSKEAPSIGSLISLRIHSQKWQLEQDHFFVSCDVLKDKHLGPGAHFERSFRGPPGLR